MRPLARGTVRATAWGGAAFGVAVAVLAVEGIIASKMVKSVETIPPPDPTGWYGDSLAEPALRVGILGDSSAAGYGMEHAEDTPGAVLARGLAKRSGRRVYLRDLAVVGALSEELFHQVNQALELDLDAVVILIGANDVVRMKRPPRAVRHLRDQVRRLRDAGIEVVVGTCPDLGTIDPILPPLRQMARTWSRRLAIQQTIEVVRVGGRTLSLVDLLGPEFRADPDFLFGPDKFHPSVAGYEAAAEALLPTLMAALGLIGDEEAHVETYRGKTALPIAAAALRAVNVPGTELDAVPRPRHRLGRLWVKVVHR